MNMVPAAEFRRHAGECRQMARGTRDLKSKATWTGLADRWDRCAALEEGRTSPARHAAKHRREPKPLFGRAS